MKFKKIPYPDVNEVISETQKHPEKTGVLALEYLLSCNYIDEANRLREQADETSNCDRDSYRRNGELSFTLETALGKCKITYPRLRGFNVREANPAVESSLVEELEQEISEIYISGDSDRDISHDLESAGIEISRSTVSRYYRKEEQKDFEAFEHLDLKNSSFLCLQVDSMYTKARVPTSDHPKYEEVALARVIGLEVESRCFRLLALEPFPGESQVGYEILFDLLLDNNIGEIFLVDTDHFNAFTGAVMSSFIGCEHQKCIFHYQQITVRTAKDSESLNQGIELFREAHEKDDREEAKRHFESLVSKIKQDDPKLAYKLKKNFKATLPYKNYPEVFAKDISTTNQDERSNEETRRREDPIHASPSVTSNVEIAFAATKREEQKWSLNPKGDASEMQQAVKIHKKMLESLYKQANIVIRRFPEFIFEDFSETEFPALWINLIIVPIFHDRNEMTLGFLAVHGVRDDKSLKLLSLIPVKENSRKTYLECARSLIERGLCSETVRLIILTRPNRKIEEVFSSVFSRAYLYMEPSAFLERIDYLVWDDGMRTIVDVFFKRIYSASDYSTARKYLDQFVEILKAGELKEALKYFDRFNGKSLVNAFLLVDEKIWNGIGLKDFELRNNWKYKCKQLRNHPVNVTETVRGLKNSLKRKATTHKQQR